MSMTQEELADALGISQSAVSQMLSCTMLISTEMVMKIAIVLGQSPTTIDPAYFKRFDMNRSDMIGFLTLELMKLKPVKAGMVRALMPYYKKSMPNGISTVAWLATCLKNYLNVTNVFMVMP